MIETLHMANATLREPPPLTAAQLLEVIQRLYHLHRTTKRDQRAALEAQCRVYVDRYVTETTIRARAGTIHSTASP